MIIYLICAMFALACLSGCTMAQFTPSSKHTGEQWNYKFSFTRSINSQLVIECDTNDQIWIGWSHYGTRTPAIAGEFSIKSMGSNKNSQSFPNENDCWMNFTEKIAEQCNGSPQCELSSQPTYIHKCGKTSDYLYVAYKCIKETDTFDICRPVKRTYTYRDLIHDSSFYVKSSEFPDEYASSVDCSCVVSTTAPTNLKLDFLWFSLQDNDYLSLFEHRNLTGWINPTYEVAINARVNKIRFVTDDSLAYKGFWLKVSERRACKDDWQLVGDMCVKVFAGEQLDWRSANQRCQKMNANLLKIDDVVADLKLTQYMSTFYPEVTSYWIGLRKLLDEYNQEKWTWSTNSTSYNDVSWWPWRKAPASASTHTNNNNNHCVIKRKNEDGYFTTSCDSSVKNSFICQTNTIHPVVTNLDSEIKLQCGQTADVDRDMTKTNLVDVPKSILISDELIGGINSIHNVVLSDGKQQPLTFTSYSSSSASSSSILPVITGEPTAQSSTLGFKLVKTSEGVNSPDLTVERSQSSNVKSGTAETPRLNTAILAGIISGIGLVILIVNIGVLFICRRNLKKFRKSTKDPARNSHTDMIIQEYFDTFNTLHHTGKVMRGGLAPSTILALGQPLAQHTFKPTSSSGSSCSSGGEDLLLNHSNESAQLFYNPQLLTLRQSSSAFKPFTGGQQQQHLETMSNDQLNELVDLQRQLLHRQSNQYDKMNHPCMLVKNRPANESTGQYAHTYESLDTLELPNRRAIVHLGVSSRNYRTLLPTTAETLNHSNLSPNSTSTDQANTTNLTELANFNLSTSSSSSSSSSSNKFIVTNNNLISLPGGLKHLTALPNGGDPGAANFIINSGDLMNIGTWSPADSAYYSTIPTLANYIQNGQPLSAVQHFIINASYNNHANINQTNNDQFKSHLV